eukprot:6479609-Amphidinium_carterae.1
MQYMMYMHVLIDLSDAFLLFGVAFCHSWATRRRRYTSAKLHVSTPSDVCSSHAEVKKRMWPSDR